MRVMAVDPGVSTGVVVARVRSDGTVLVGGFDQFKTDVNSAVQHILTELFWSDVDVLVLEKFDLRPGNTFKADLTPVKVNAILDYVSATHPDVTWEVVYQTPTQAKTLIPDEALKRLDFWPTGKDVNQPDADDVRDAARHLYRYLIMEHGLKHLAKQITS